jgi:hypothetical protein
MQDVYNLSNHELVSAFKKKDYKSLKSIASKSIFLIPVKNKDNINKIAFEAMMDSTKSLYLPIFINMADMRENKMIKGRQVLIAHFGMIETILKNNPKLTGIVINAGTMDCKLNMEESFEICSLYQQLENKGEIDFEPEYYKPESFTMADLKPKVLMPRLEVSLPFLEYIKKTPIRKAYLRVQMVGGKLNYTFYLDYNKQDQSFVDELMFILDEAIDPNETYEILNAKQGANVKSVKFLKPIYVKR